MSNRVPQLRLVINSRRTNLFSTFRPGADVGARSIAVRRALARRATLNPGTMKNPKKGLCIGFCYNGRLQPPPGQF